MAKKNASIYSLHGVKRQSTSVQGIERVSRISRVSPVYDDYSQSASEDSKEDKDEESVASIVQPSTIVNLSHVKTVLPTPYGNMRRGGFMIGDENTLMRATWALLGFAANVAPQEQQQAKVKLLRDMERLMQLPKSVVQPLEQAFLQGRSGQVSPRMLGNKLQSWVGKDSVLLDITAELMVYIALEGQKLTSELITHIMQGVQYLNVSKVRLQHLIQTRQRELTLGAYFKKPQGSYIAFQLPQKPTAQHKNKVLVEYALSLLGLEIPYTMEQVSTTTQALVLHYAPVNLSQQHVPRPLIRLCSKKVSETIAAYNLLRS